MDDILFTCAGTSDPVRGNRDGGILHIMRYYHPKRVYLFLSQQIADLEAQDHRFEKTFQHMQEYCAAHGVVYQPELIIHNSGLDDVSKIDLVEEPLLEYFTSAAVENPNCRILLNLSSGTPQMKTLMQFLAVDSPYHVLGVQVDGPQKKKGEKDPPRTDDRMYNVDYELETNYDDEPDCLPEGERRNRTSEPEMFAIKHQRFTNQVNFLKNLFCVHHENTLLCSQNLDFLRPGWYDGREFHTVLGRGDFRDNVTGLFGRRSSHVIFRFRHKAVQSLCGRWKRGIHRRVQRECRASSMFQRPF